MAWERDTLLPKVHWRTDVWTVYGIVYECGLLYIGCSKQPHKRLVSHRCTNFPEHDVSMIVLGTFKKKAKAIEAEELLIKTLNPMCNAVTNSPKLWTGDVRPKPDDWKKKWAASRPYLDMREWGD
jgi:predicted GIY-YIG superfamily endonuclease